MQTAIPTTPTATPATRLLVQHYAAELAERREQLLDDLAVFQRKVRDLDQIDPLDFTGLGRLYRSHLVEIEELLEEFDDDDSP